ncbi:hypothetical protein Ahy_A03g012075 isoform B [Arachis hypogaea]|uniref:Uncharacterized protein n=1 Tax=Arachis hypogaea TaxID=3818 RepID=A0A445DSI4_ARAHY|nr:hypothetical protein Ahy_A03g012075 isoform B [Arachis hypogaea]
MNIILSGVFSSGIGDHYYPSNDLDPYIKDKNDDDDSEELEDMIINPTDSVIVCARTEDDLSLLEVKLWDLSNNQPSVVASKNSNAGAVFSISLSEDNPFVLAIGGSEGKLQGLLRFLSQDDDDSEELEDMIINPTDSVIVCARTEDDLSLLEVHILEDVGTSEMNIIYF